MGKEGCMQNFTKSKQLFILIVGIIFIGIFLHFGKMQKINLIEVEKDIEGSAVEQLTSNEQIFVHICGAVNSPGMYELSQEARLDDAIKLAGGLAYNADVDNINLAEKLSDEQKIKIPEIGDINVNSMQDKTDTKININTADELALQTLPGIGEKKAQLIIDYRENQLFKQKEDIMNIEGIGKKTYEKIKDLISV